MTIEIQLTKGYMAIVDDIDADLAEMKWYPLTNKKGKTVYASNANRSMLHQVIFERMTGIRLRGNLKVIDHVDHNGLNNQRGNLRLATNGQNIANRKLSIVGRSGIRGVRETPGGRWVAKIGGTHLGTFDTPEEAAARYHIAATERWGEFYTPNEAAQS